MSNLPTFTLFDVEVTAIDDAVAAGAIIAGEISGTVHFANTHVMSESVRSQALKTALELGTVLPDGMPLVWIARRDGVPGLKRRASGPDVMMACIDKGRSSGISHFLLGTDDTTLARLKSEILSEWPGTRIAGTLAPSFGDFTQQDVDSYATAVRNSGADLVWLGLSSPRQNLLAIELSSLTNQTLLCVGAAFDFISGTKRACPKWLQQLGLEWFFRLITEPRRLFRRYATSIPRFVFLYVRSRGNLRMHRAIESP